MNQPISNEKLEDLERQGYRIVGNHSAIKICYWCKQCIRDIDVCYKNTFYGINSHQCVQMTPAFHTCSHRCSWCWRDIDFTQKEWSGPVDDPKDIIKGCIEAQKKILQGFKGNQKLNPEILKQALQPKHFAISLSGEPTFYPRLPELIQELHNQNLTSFIVTNGTNPEMIEKLINSPITQFYITLPAPDEETYKKVCAPLTNDSWNKIIKSLTILKNLKCKRAIRLTLCKGENMLYPKKYAELIKDVDFDYLECKAYVWVGHSQNRLNREAMPEHDEIIKFANEIAKHVPNLKIVNEKKESRVVLLSR